MFFNPISRAMCATATLASLCLGDVVVPSGTRVACRLEQTISSATADEGQQVQLSVTENVKVNDQIVIPQGSACVGTVVIASAKRSMGRSGKLDFSIDKVRSGDGESVPLRYTMHKKQGEGKGMSTGVMTASAAVLFWPAAPFFLMRKGKDVTINKGIVIEVFTDAEHIIKSGRGGATAPQVISSLTSAVPNAAPSTVEIASVSLANVTIASDIPDAEVEVDGGFIGNTPSTAKLSPGLHKITVKSGASVWSRDLNVQPGGMVNVKATLRR
ncbi:MAG TPA: PEGA domain-containing protein [Bryobacteraceae bacterium]|nr:PEGA domain-containing protein [Bryobacteraceae bacterium]